MKKIFLLTGIIIYIFSLGVSYIYAQKADPKLDKRAQAFFKEFKEAIKKGDKAKILDMIQIPCNFVSCDVNDGQDLKLDRDGVLKYVLPSLFKEYIKTPIIKGKKLNYENTGSFTFSIDLTEGECTAYILLKFKENTDGYFKLSEYFVVCC